MTQSRVVGALILREMHSRYASTRLGFAWALADPLAQIVLLSSLWLAVARLPPLGSDVILFMATGVATFSLFRNVEQRTRNALSANAALLAYPVVKPIDFFIARFVLENAIFIGVLLALSLLMSALSFGHAPAEPLQLLAAGSVTSIFALGLGMTGAVAFRFFPGMEKIFDLALRPLYFVSGIFFLPDDFPIEARDILALNPVLHAIAWVRDAVYPGYTSPVLEKGYLIASAGFFLVLGLLLEKRFRSQVTP